MLLKLRLCRYSRIKGNFKIFDCHVFSILGFLKNILVNILGYTGILIMPFAGHPLVPKELRKFGRSL